MLNKDELLLYAITDCDNYQGEELLKRTELILQNDATMLQYRDKHGKAKDDVAALKALCVKYGVPFIINDDVDLALAIDADGVHVGQDDTAAVQAREKLGPDKILGVTAKTLAQAQKAVADGADYLGVGALFHSMSKDSSLLAREDLKAITAGVAIPVVGIGGISEDNAAILAGTGIAGVAVINALYSYPNPSLVTKRLARKVGYIVNGDADLAGVLADVDGTLTDTLAFYQNLVPNFLKDNGYRPGGDLIQILSEKTLPESIGYVKHNYSGAFGVGQVVDDLEAELEWYYHTEGKAKPGVKAFLARAQEKQVPVVATSIHDAEVCRTLFEHAGILEQITNIASGWDKRYPGGDSRLFDMAVAMIGAAPDHIWAFNDGIEGIFGAKGASVKIAAIYDENHSEKEWAQIIKNADVAFMNWQEACEWLG
ncbi:MAG: thiamine phosphate synthase [Peptococcaceae bacterium]|nr:thiamine phosphate synthase [Peptococcaceae bacterium]